MYRRAVLLLSAAMLLTACTRAADGDGEGSGGAAAPEAPRERTPCERASDALSVPVAASGAAFDVEAARGRLTETTDRELPSLLDDFATHGEAAAVLVPDVAARMTGDTATQAGLRFILMVDPAEGVSRARALMSDADAPLTSRYVAASTLARAGRHGLEVLNTLALESAGGGDTYEAILASIRQASAFPDAAREVLFGEGGFCRTAVDPGPCYAVGFDIALGSPGFLAEWPSDPSFRALLTAELSVYRDPSTIGTWVETAATIPAEHRGFLLESTNRLMASGFRDELAPAVILLATSEMVPARQRRMFGFWLLSSGGLISAHAEAIAAAAAGGDDEVAPFLMAAALVAGTTEIPADWLPRLAAVDTAGDRDLGILVALLTARLGGTPPPNPQLPAGLADVVAAEAAVDPSVLLASLASADLPSQSARDAALLWAAPFEMAVDPTLAPRVERLMQAVSADPALASSPDWVALAARHPGAGDAIVQAAWASTGTADSLIVARRLAALGVEGLESEVERLTTSSARASERLGLQLALVAGLEVPRERLLAMIVDPDDPGRFELDVVPVRRLALLRLLGEEVDLAEASGVRGGLGVSESGFVEAGILLSRARETACESP